MATKKTLAQMSPAARRQRIAELVRNPGTRAAVPTQYLPAEYRQKRQAAVAAKQPLVPGGLLTYGDFLKQRKAAADAQFAPQQQALEQQARDVPAWYDDYQNQLKAIQQGVADTYQRLGAGAPPAPETPAGPGGDEAARAAASRDALRKAFATDLQGQGAAANAYLASLQGLAGAKKTQQRQVIADQVKQLGQRRGEFYTDYTGKARQQEFENALSYQTLTGNQAADAAKAQAAAQKTNEYGYSTAEWAQMSPSERQAAIKRFKTYGKSAPSGYGPGRPGMNKFGYTYDEWAGLSASDRAKARAGKDGGSSSSGAPEWLAPGQMSAGLAQLTQIKQVAAKAKAGQPFEAGHGKQKRLDRRGAAEKITANYPPVKDPALLTAALDAVYDSHLSGETVQRLIAAGYKPSRVAQALGVPTAQQWRKGARRTSASRTGGT